MRPFARKLLCTICMGALALAAIACDETVVAPPQAPTPAKAKPSASAKAKGAESADAEDASEVPMVEFSEADFVESEDSRDPFRDYAYMFVKKSRAVLVVQRKVKAADFSLDELRLVGIITRGKHSVLLTDPQGFGWILYTGDYVGRAELVSAGGTDGSEVAINWRVDRIRNDSVVFIREDSAHPDIPPTTREMPLYPEGERGTRG